MVTEGIMEMLEVMLNAVDGTAHAQMMDVVVDAIGYYDEDEWYEMTDEQKKNWVREYIVAHITL